MGEVGGLMSLHLKVSFSLLLFLVIRLTGHVDPLLVKFTVHFALTNLRVDSFCWAKRGFRLDFATRELFKYLVDFDAALLWHNRSVMADFSLIFTDFSAILVNFELMAADAISTLDSLIDTLIGFRSIWDVLLSSTLFDLRLTLHFFSPIEMRSLSCARAPGDFASLERRE